MLVQWAPKENDDREAFNNYQNESNDPRKEAWWKFYGPARLHIVRSKNPQVPNHLEKLEIKLIKFSIFNNNLVLF